jgi:hypothetical protein
MTSTRHILNISVDQIKPDSNGVFQSQGIPPGTSPSLQVKELYDSVEQIFLNLAEPMGIIADISQKEFARIYRGNGKNEPDTPLEHIYPRADYLALFAFTLGEEISREIQRQLEDRNLAKGYMLDAVASYCTDKASNLGQEFFYNRLVSSDLLHESGRVLLYSPGYCGWHVSGQRELFAYLKPQEIEIHLNESFLMVPLKSISGVLAAGDGKIHQFVNNYPFCANCRTYNCRERIKSLDEQQFFKKS